MVSEHTCNQRVLSLCPICSLIKRQDHYTGAFSRMQRSTMGKKMWLSMLPRNFGSAKIVCMYDCMYICPHLLCKPGWNVLYRAPAHFSCKSHGHPDLLERKIRQQQSWVFLSAKFVVNVYIGEDNREWARARARDKKQRRSISFRRKTWKFYNNNNNNEGLY